MADVNGGLDNRSGQSMDLKTHKLVQGKSVPYASVAEAVAHPRLVSDYRYQSLDGIYIMVAGEPVEHWFKNGIADGDLIPKEATVGSSNNRITFNLTVDGTIVIPADVDVLKIRVKPVGAALLAFRMYILVAAVEVDMVFEQDLPADTWKPFHSLHYSETPTTVYVTGITTNTTIVLIKG